MTWQTICFMIIKAIRFRTKSNVNRLINHLKNGADNEAITFCQGTPSDIKDMQQSSVSKKSTFSIRHWIIAPHEALTRDQMLDVIQMIGTEFDFDPAKAVIIEHMKRRADHLATNRHWHILVAERDPITAKSLKCSFDRIIHELIARYTEYKYGHKFVPGRHNGAVLAGLRQRGLTDAAQALANATSGIEKPVGAAFTQAQQQEKKRLGIDLPKIRKMVKNIALKVNTKSELETCLAQEGLIVAFGEKSGTWILTDANGQFIGSLPRFAGKTKSEIDKLMKENKNEQPNFHDNGTSDFERSFGNPNETGSTRERNSTFEPRDARPDASQNNRMSGTSAFTLGSNESIAVPTADPKIGSEERAGGLSGCEDQIAALLGRAILLEMTAEERVTASLWEMEETANFDFHRVVPEFRFSDDFLQLRSKTRDIEQDLLKCRGNLVDSQINLQKYPAPKWWHHIFGAASIMDRRNRSQSLAVENARAALAVSEQQFKHMSSQLMREEAREKSNYAQLVKNISERKATAAQRLKEVDTANSILKKRPDFALCGLDFILSKARDSISNSSKIRTLNGSRQGKAKNQFTHSQPGRF